MIVLRLFVCTERHCKQSRFKEKRFCKQEIILGGGNKASKAKAIHTGWLPGTECCPLLLVAVDTCRECAGAVLGLYVETGPG